LSFFTGILSSCSAVDTYKGRYRFSISAQKEARKTIIQRLLQDDIIPFYYGDTTTVLVPTDKYFLFNSAKLSEECFPALKNIVRLYQYCPSRTVYVAGFTDGVGSFAHKKRLTQARAEAMVTFLWAHGIRAELLQAEGYADAFSVAPNAPIHSSAYNRRLEIQWANDCKRFVQAPLDMQYTK
jgi:outer membrane protein OmpA-like peptidoglycan-associated protein